MGIKRELCVMYVIFSGEVALPGGKAKEGDKDDGDTAKREAKEEIGLDPELVNVVTYLNHSCHGSLFLFSFFFWSFFLY